jgi:hypothetical protein
MRTEVSSAVLDPDVSLLSFHDPEPLDRWTRAGFDREHRQEPKDASLGSLAMVAPPDRVHWIVAITVPIE